MSGHPDGAAHGAAHGAATRGGTNDDAAVERVGISFDGTPISARAGVSVGAALTDAGIRSWRRARIGGDGRGLFCGIGVCFDCLITVDGAPNQRACLVPVAEGMRLTSGVGDDERGGSDEDAHG